jgi:hypothetical protein
MRHELRHWIIASTWVGLIGCAVNPPAPKEAQAPAQGREAVVATAPQGAVVSHWRVVSQQGQTTFLSDTQMQQEQSVRIQALTPQGAQALVKRVFTVNQTLERFELLDAATLKADGRRLAVGPAEITRQQGSVSRGDAPSWQDMAVVQVNFPDLQAGDEIEFSTRQERRAALPGWLYEDIVVEPTVPMVRFEWTVEAPSTLPLQVDSQLMQAQSTSQAGTQRWRFSHGPSSAIAAEPNMYNTNPWLPRVMASTLPDLASLSDRFAQGLRQKVQPSPALQALAQELTQGVTDPREQALAIAHWVRDNVRYVAVYLGAGGYEPRDVDEVLRTRYGDCKDHVLLMHSLLAAVNIEAAPALVFTGMSDQLPPVAVSAFNHVITYLPQWQLFVDTTARDHPVTALPFGVSDKPAWVGLPGGSQALHTPGFTAAGNRLVVTTDWTVHADGSASVNMHTQASGESATVLQDRLQEIPPIANSVAVSKLLNDSGWRGRGFLRYDPIQRDRQTQSFNAEADIQSFLADPANGGQVNPSQQLTRDALSVARNMGNFEATARRFAKLCVPISVRENFTWRFAPEFKITSVPTDFSRTASGRFGFEAQYEQAGQVVSGWREFSRTQTSHHCTPSDYARDAATHREIAQHLRTSLGFSR